MTYEVNELLKLSHHISLFQGKGPSRKDLESYLKLANKERNVLERKIALLEKTRQQTGDEKIDNEISALRQQHKELLQNITAKVLFDKSTVLLCIFHDFLCNE